MPLSTCEEETMKSFALCLTTVLVISICAVSNVSAHCEIPCGIYDDTLRIKMIYEHTLTIEKAMNEIIRLGQENPVDYNQLIRWVSNKEAHASEIQHIVSQYFMTQRIKLDSKDYSKKLTLLHQLLVYSMKAKQTTDLENVNKIQLILLMKKKSLSITYNL